MGSFWSEHRHWLSCLSPHLEPVLALAVDPVTENLFFITKDDDDEEKVREGQMMMMMQQVLDMCKVEVIPVIRSIFDQTERWISK